jgi:gliding motility-associated-like protein
MGPRIFYTDEVPFTSAVYYYRLEVINSCGIAAEQSNRANNIILNGTLANMVASLGWNEYRDWLGNVDQYRIIRTLGQDNPVTDTLDAGNANSFSDDVSQFINYADPTQGLVCYSVVATENTNTYGINGKSQSNPVCFSVNPGVQIPNAFIPNDTEPANQVFEPVFSFLPDHYEMYIYNRLGSKIWEGSQAWDGRVNGKFVPEGVYAYYIRVYNYSSDITEFSGKVTVLYR